MPQPKDYLIFEEWYNTTNWLLDRCERMPKHTRFTISGRIVNLALETVELLLEAIYTEQRKHLLHQLNLNLEKLRFFNRLCKDRHYLSLTQYEFLARAINKTGKMCGGWLKSLSE
ncbi:MAG: diversity-generating retroelement protein Avd [Saprospiraceae bacterium]|nr:diversity-generating retroelement protein Avd [Saprospiraceae bacterium]